jgi:hypothetical protein
VVAETVRVQRRRPPRLSEIQFAVLELARLKRWTVGRKRGIALRLLRGETLDAVSRDAGVPMYCIMENELLKKSPKKPIGRTGRQP